VKGLKQVWLELKPKANAWVGRRDPRTEERGKDDNILLWYKGSFFEIQSHA